MNRALYYLTLQYSFRLVHKTRFETAFCPLYDRWTGARFTIQSGDIVGEITVQYASMLERWRRISFSPDILVSVRVQSAWFTASIISVVTRQPSGVKLGHGERHCHVPGTNIRANIMDVYQVCILIMKKKHIHPNTVITSFLFEVG